MILFRSCFFQIMREKSFCFDSLFRALQTAQQVCNQESDYTAYSAGNPVPGGRDGEAVGVLDQQSNRRADHEAEDGGERKRSMLLQKEVHELGDEDNANQQTNQVGKKNGNGGKIAGAQFVHGIDDGIIIAQQHDDH